MSPVTHLLASWSLAEASGLDSRERAVVAWIGLSPDLDGLGVLAFVLVRAATAGRSPVQLFSETAHATFVATVQARWRQMRRAA